MCWKLNQEIIEHITTSQLFPELGLYFSSHFHCKLYLDAWKHNFWLYFLSLVAEEPDLSKLVVCNITSDRLCLSWRTGQRDFDHFVVEVRESDSPSQAVGRSLPGDVRSTLMGGLKASTSYNITLYARGGGGQKTQSLHAVATTGSLSCLLVSCMCQCWCAAGQRNWRRVLLSLRGRPTVGAYSCFFHEPSQPQLVLEHQVRTLW